MSAAETEAPPLSLRGVTVRAGEKVLLDRVSLDLHAGDFAILLGPNGGGKSTLLFAVLGLIPIQSGTILFFGKPIAASRHRIGYLPQRFPIDRTLPLTAREFLDTYVGARRVGRPGKHDTHADRKRLNESVERLGLGAKLNTPFGSLSGGEIQRLLLAAAFSDAPDLLLFDEPMAGVDAQGEEHFYTFLAEYRAAHPKAALLVVSHDIGVVWRHASRVFCLNRELHADGPPQDALTEETFRRLYGEGGFHGAHHHHHHHEH